MLLLSGASSTLLVMLSVLPSSSTCFFIVRALHHLALYLDCRPVTPSTVLLPLLYNSLLVLVPASSVLWFPFLSCSLSLASVRKLFPSSCVLWSSVLSEGALLCLACGLTTMTSFSCCLVSLLLFFLLSFFSHVCWSFVEGEATMT